MEVDAFACSNKALIFFDSRGYDYILDEEYMIIVTMSSRCKSYKLSVTEFETKYLFKGI